MCKNLYFRFLFFSRKDKLEGKKLCYLSKNVLPNWCPTERPEVGIIGMENCGYAFVKAEYCKAILPRSGK